MFVKTKYTGTREMLGYEKTRSFTMPYWQLSETILKLPHADMWLDFVYPKNGTAVTEYRGNGTKIIVRNSSPQGPFDVEIITSQRYYAAALLKSLKKLEKEHKSLVGLAAEEYQDLWDPDPD